MEAWVNILTANMYNANYENNKILSEVYALEKKRLLIVRFQKIN